MTATAIADTQLDNQDSVAFAQPAFEDLGEETLTSLALLHQEEPPLLPCPRCGKSKSQDDFVWSKGRPFACKACHCLHSKVARKTRDPELQDFALSKLSKEDRRQFYSDNADASEDVLAAKMQESITRTKSRFLTTRFTGRGTFLDEADLREKYKEKPEQLANMLKHAETYLCPYRKVELYKDMEFTAVDIDEKKQRVAEGN